MILKLEKIFIFLKKYVIINIEIKDKVEVEYESRIR